MKFKNIRHDAESQTVNFDVECSNTETAFLVNHAVQDLLSAGVIAIDNLNKEEQEVTLRGVAH